MIILSWFIMAVCITLSVLFLVSFIKEMQTDRKAEILLQAYLRVRQRMDFADAAGDYADFSRRNRTAKLLLMRRRNLLTEK